jgi:hypothetical protein
LCSSGSLVGDASPASVGQDGVALRTTNSFPGLQSARYAHVRAATGAAHCWSSPVVLHQGSSLLTGLLSKHSLDRPWTGLQHHSFSTDDKPQTGQSSHLPQRQDPGSQAQAQGAQAASANTSKGSGVVSSDPESLYSLPNLVSLSRALSAPLIAGLILSEAWEAAIVATAISGVGTGTRWSELGFQFLANLVVGSPALPAVVVLGLGVACCRMHTQHMHQACRYRHNLQDPHGCTYHPVFPTH